MAENETRPLRLCDSCGQVDDHPRHVVAHAPGAGATDGEIAARALRNAPEEAYETVIAQIRDDALIAKHMDCCAADGCPDGSCDKVVAEAQGRQGDSLVAHLTGKEA